MFIPKKLTLTNIISHRSTIFEFPNGKAKLVVGQNNDREGQKGNGSGKSALNEAISIAVTGTTIRDGLMREFIFRGEVEGEIEFILTNSQTGKDLIIWRKIYASTSKSSECTIWNNGNDLPVKKTGAAGSADINECNKYVLDQFGISRDDFFNFFLITKEKYVPFLSTSDTLKKATINRFSGANSVDNTKEFIDRDSEAKQALVTKANDRVVAAEARLELLNEQLTKLQEETSEESIKEEREEVNKKILAADGNIFQYNFDIKRLGKNLRTFVGERKTLIRPKKLDLLFSEIGTQISVLETLSKTTAEKKKDLSSFDTRVKEVTETETEAKEMQDAIKEAKLESKETQTSLEKELNETNNKIQGAITCPKCSHEFSLRYADFDIVAAKARVRQIEQIDIPLIEKEIEGYENDLNDYKEVFEAIEEDKESINNDIIKYRRNIDIEIGKITIKIERLQAHNRKIKSIEREFNQKIENFKQKVEDSFREFSRTLQRLKTEKTLLAQLKENLTKLDEVDTSGQVELQTQIKTLEEEIEVDKQALQVLVNEKAAIDEWQTNFKGFKSYLANQSIKNISDYTNLFLNAINSNITIEIEGYKMLSNKKIKEEITTTVFRDGFSVGSYGMFSAGERGRIEICVILALRELVNLNSPSGGLDLMICDEILDSVDSLGLEYLIDSLQVLEQTILIVSQNEINALSSNTITIEKTNGVSTIVA